MTSEELQQIISDKLNTEIVQVESADNVHFYVTVVSADFAGMTKIKQHKLVKELFAEQFADESIHAMSLKTLTPEKWAEKQSDKTA